MIAIPNPNRTIYDCNFFQKGPNMIAMIENLFSRNSCRNHSHVTLGRISTLQSYLDLIETDCNHIWSALDLSLRSYSVPFLSKLAIIFGPHIKIIAIINGPALYNSLKIPVISDQAGIALLEKALDHMLLIKHLISYISTSINSPFFSSNQHDDSLMSTRTTRNLIVHVYHASLPNTFPTFLQILQKFFKKFHFFKPSECLTVTLFILYLDVIIRLSQKFVVSKSIETIERFSLHSSLTQKAHQWFATALEQSFEVTRIRDVVLTEYYSVLSTKQRPAM